MPTWFLGGRLPGASLVFAPFSLRTRNTQQRGWRGDPSHPLWRPEVKVGQPGRGPGRPVTLTFDHTQRGSLVAGLHLRRPARLAKQ